GLNEADDIAELIEQRYGVSPTLSPWDSVPGRDAIFDLEGGNIEVQFGISTYLGYPNCNGAIVYKNDAKKEQAF
ncbi:MAG: hypothetical protein ACOC42_00830, partial [Halobacteriota archaeon]